MDRRRLGAGQPVEAAQFDVVYHLAAEFGRWNGEDYYENLWRTNAVGTKNIIRMQEREGFQAVYFSSSEVYGDYDGVMSEDVMDRVEIKQINDYAMSKWVNEMQILNSATQYGTKSVRVRLFNTYGPGEYYSPYRSVICLFCYRILHDIPITSTAATSAPALTSPTWRARCRTSPTLQARRGLQHRRRGFPHHRGSRARSCCA